MPKLMAISCTVEDCAGGRPIIRGFCNAHYLRFRATGDPLGSTLKTSEQRFWPKVNKTATCWLWKRRVNDWGYGTFQHKDATWLAHRAAWDMFVGPIPDGVQIDHKCHTPSCVNPKHLRLATGKQNQENHDGTPKGQTRSGIRGVHWHGATGRWTARVGHNRNTHYLGLFDNLEDAAAAVLAKRLELHTFNDWDRVGA